MAGSADQRARKVRAALRGLRSAGAQAGFKYAPLCAHTPRALEPLSVGFPACRMKLERLWLPDSADEPGKTCVRHTYPHRSVAHRGAQPQPLLAMRTRRHPNHALHDAQPGAARPAAEPV